MLAREQFDALFTFLAEALNWRVSDTTRDMAYYQIYTLYTDDEFMGHVQMFCDRGHGTAAEFLAYLKQERLRSHQSPMATTLPPRVYPQMLLTTAEKELPEWVMPGEAEIRTKKLLALIGQGYRVDYQRVQVTEEDLRVIRQTRISRIGFIDALKAIYPKTGDSTPRSTSRSGMNSIGDVFGQ